jgi:hypothetical protein
VVSRKPVSASNQSITGPRLLLGVLHQAAAVIRAPVAKQPKTMKRISLSVGCFRLDCRYDRFLVGSHCSSILRIAIALASEPDLVLVDIVLPVDGSDLARLTPQLEKRPGFERVLAP